jgi:CHAT domain-containing protein/Tfp pilus assembly protein PilF
MLNVRTVCRPLVSRFTLHVCIGLFFALMAFAQSPDEVALRRMIEKFFASYQREAIDDLISMCDANSPELEAMKQRFQQTFAASEKIQIQSLKILKISLDADRAVARVLMDVSAVDATTGKLASGFGWMDRTLRCAKTADGWKVSSYVTTANEFAPKLVAAEMDEERRKILGEEQLTVTDELSQALIREGDRYYSQALYAIALKAYDLALNMAREVGHKRSEYLALIRKGVISHIKGNYDEALRNGEDSLRIAEELADRTFISAALNNIGLVLQLQGNYRKAVQYYQRDLSICEELGDKSGIATAFTNIATVLESEGNYAEASEYHQKALWIAEQLGDKRLMANILANLGIVLRSQGNSREALEYFQKSLKIQQESGQKALVIPTLMNIGLSLSSQGNYSLALRYYHQCLRLAEESGERFGVPTILVNIGLLHERQGNQAQALEYCQRALKIAEESGDKPLTATTLEKIGTIRESQGERGQALRYYEKSLALAEELGRKGDIALGLSRIASIHQQNGDLNRGMDYYQKSLKLAEELGSRRVIMEALYGIANHWHLEGMYDKAIELWNRATAIARESGEIDSLWRLRMFTGKTHRAANHADQARRAFEDAIESIESMRAQVAGYRQEQQQFFESRVAPYHLMVDLLVGQKADAEAFAYAERAKGRALLDAIESDVAQRATSMTTEEKERERKLIGQIVSLNARIYRQRASPQPDESLLKELNAHLEKARLEYEAFMTGLYAAHPELKVWRGEMKPLKLEEVGPLLENATTAFLEFVVTEHRTHLFVLTKKGSQPTGFSSSPDLKVYTIDIDQKELAQRAALFRERVANKDVGIDHIARDLYDLLLRPAQEQLKNKTALVIVPDDALWELPFQALKPARDRYLLEECAISYVPSLTVLGEMTKARARKATRASTTLLAFGNPSIGEETVQKVASIFMGEKLLPLPEAERQVRALADLYGPERSRVYVGPDAREDRAKLEAGSCRILHIATHGIVNDSSPLYSHLVLARPEGGSDEDGLLEAWEIMDLDLKADLVVLSACDTARGRVAPGEGMVGLAWAFFIAGCPTTVVSQWSVEAASTTELMVEFHRNLRRKLNDSRSPVTKAEALRLASLKLLRSRAYRHPFYWAPFVLIGESR